jgi:hypothetical protein
MPLRRLNNHNAAPAQDTHITITRATTTINKTEFFLFGSGAAHNGWRRSRQGLRLNLPAYPWELLQREAKPLRVPDKG